MEIEGERERASLHLRMYVCVCAAAERKGKETKGSKQEGRKKGRKEGRNRKIKCTIDKITFISLFFIQRIIDTSREQTNLRTKSMTIGPADIY